MASIYVASKTKHADLWKQLRSDGLNIVSTWIDEAGEGATKCFSELAERCINEVAESDLVLMYCVPGELHKGSLFEAGAALALGKAVYCAGRCESLSRVFDAHPLWFQFDTLEDALNCSQWDQ